jgi:segregation and condensation protein B
MTDLSLKTIIEGLLFVADEPLSLERLAQAFEEDLPRERLSRAVDELINEYEELGRAFVLRPVAGGFQFRTRPELSSYILRLLDRRSPARLSRAALETLAIIAYLQPILRAEVEKIRGVDAGGMIKSLRENDLVRVAGRRALPGRPIAYGTTKKFLETFDLPGLEALPSMEELKSRGVESDRRLFSSIKQYKRQQSWTFILFGSSFEAGSAGG